VSLDLCFFLFFVFCFLFFVFCFLFVFTWKELKSIRSSGKVDILRHQVGQAWLTSSKIAIKASHFQTAYSSILQAQQNGMLFSFVQGCKLTRALGEPLRALQELSHSIKNAPVIPALKPDDKPNPEARPPAKVSHIKKKNPICCNGLIGFTLASTMDA
jgi:hypothetical protein